MWLLCISLLAAASAASGLRIHGHAVTFNATTHLGDEARRLSSRPLKIVQTRVPPRNPLLIFAPYTYLVSTTIDQPMGGYTDQSIEGEAAYLPEYKYAAAHANLTRFMAQVTSGHPSPHIPHCHVDVHTTRKRWYCHCSRPMVAALAELDEVIWISPLPQISYHSFGDTYGMLIGAGGGTPLIQGLNGSRQRVVVSDTDIDPAHAAFYVADKTVALGSVDSGAHPKLHGILNIPGYTNFGSNNGSHGQMTASLLAGYAWADGVQSGMAPGAALVFIDLSPAGQEIILIPSNFFDTLEYLHRNHGVNLHSGSWGSVSTVGEIDLLAYDGDVCAYDNPTLVFVQSGGNNPDAAISSPSTALNWISVGSTTYDVEEQAYFTSTGLLEDGRRGPLVTAPGYRVTAARAVYPPDPGHVGQKECTGTSCSAPILAGLICRLQDRYAIRNGENMTSALVRASILAHAVPPTRIFPTGDPSTITTYGTPQFEWDAMTDYQGVFAQSAARKAICFSSPNVTNQFNVALAWIDVPGLALVNDMDMLVVVPSGVYFAEDGVHPHELIRGAEPTPFMRVVMYPYGGSVTGTGNVHVAIHASAPDMVSVECGTCFPDEYLACGSGATAGYSYCEVEGEMSVCYPSSSGSAEAGTCEPVEEGAAAGATQNGTCVVTSCMVGYMYTNQTCVCIPNTVRACEEEEGAYKYCLPDGWYSECSTLGTSRSSVGKIVVTSSARGLGRLYVLYNVMVLTHTIIM